MYPYLNVMELILKMHRLTCIATLELQSLGLEMF